MEQIEPVSSRLPYMVAPGNHESHSNFSHFSNRFEMPMKNESANLYYSFDVGLIHFVSYNTETYFNMTGNGAASGDGNDCVRAQYLLRGICIMQHNNAPQFAPDSGSKLCIHIPRSRYNWLRDDLAAANSNRDAIPWIIAYGHRPMYCNVITTYAIPTTA